MSQEVKLAPLGIQAIADDMGVSYNTARNWVLAEMPYYKTTGGTVRVEVADYEAWKASKRVDPRQPKPGVAA